MITTLTLNGVKVEKEIPATWHEVTFKQFKALSKCTNLVQKVALFTGVDEEILVKAQIKNLNELMAILHFTEVPFDYSLPKTVLGYKIPDNLEVESIARFADIQAIIEKANPGEIFETYPLLLAHYVVEPYSYREAEKLAPFFEDAPCGEVMAIGNFTLLRSLELKSGIRNNVLPVVILLNRWRRGIKTWLRRLAFTIRYFSWKNTLPSPEKNFLSGP